MVGWAGCRCRCRCCADAFLRFDSITSSLGAIVRAIDRSTHTGWTIIASLDLHYLHNSKCCVSVVFAEESLFLSIVFVNREVKEKIGVVLIGFV